MSFPRFHDPVRWIVAACSISSALAEVDFDRQVRPILENHCTDCHGEDRPKSGLRLDHAAGLLRGGESGEPLLLAGNSHGSYLIQRVTAEAEEDIMPPEGEKLAAEEVAILRRWIDEGAAVPGGEEARSELALKTAHWSFQAVARPKVPESGDPTARGGIDAFILAKLRENNLAPSPSAARETLVRRLFLVMHGMPPTPAEVADFANDPRPDAYEQLVERVLASPRFGERFARHWMDVVRYADSNGFETNRERKSAYHYRDWLVASFNADKPYDQFIKEQLAGDQLGADAATGFLVAGPHDIVKSPDINLTLMQRQDELADMVDTTGAAFLGMTIGCARCHNHKFDPILQKDYYSMQAVFAGVSHGERPLREKRDPAVENELAGARGEEDALLAKLESYRTLARNFRTPEASGPLRPPVNARMNEENFPAVEVRSVRFIIEASSSAEPCIDEFEIYNPDGQNIAPQGTPSASGTIAGDPIHQLAHINDGKTGNDHSWISDTRGAGWVQIDFPERMSIARIVWSRARDGGFADRLPTSYRIEATTTDGIRTPISSSADRAPYEGKDDLQALIAKLPGPEAAAARQLVTEMASVRARVERLSAVSLGWAGVFAQPDPTHRLYRGEPLQKREIVAPDTLSVMGTLALEPDAPEALRRLRLAEWLASPQNPLTARVMANRIWHYTFGAGIVDSPSDFGANGAPPTHPALLDWLADELVRGGWSIKHLQRLILQSSTFRQSSTPRADALAVDAGGRLLWRYPPRRMEAEAIRDSVLAVSGALDTRMGGPGFYLVNVVEENVMNYSPKETFTPAEFRRTVYQFRVRQTSDGVFGLFDCPDGSSTTPKRSRSNTPLQALNLFNSGFIVQQADLLAERLRKSCGDDPDAQTDLAFQLLYGRRPDAVERAASADLIQTHGLAAFSRGMYNTSEFLFIF